MNLNQGKINEDNLFENLNIFWSSEYARVDDSQKQTMKLLNETLQRVPQRGTFQLDSVLDSTYFFS